VPLPEGVTPVSLKIPRDGRLVEWQATERAPGKRNEDTLVPVGLNS
jgi:hypothetical protein